MLTIKVTNSTQVWMVQVPGVPDEHIEYAPCPYKNCDKLVRVQDSKLPGEARRFCKPTHRSMYWRQFQPL